MKKTLATLLVAMAVLGAPNWADARAQKAHARAHHAAVRHVTRHVVRRPVRRGGRSHPAAGALAAQQRQLQVRAAQLSKRISSQRQRAAQLRVKEVHETKNLVHLQQKLEQTATELQDSQYRLKRAEVKLNVTQSALGRAKHQFSFQQRAASSRLRAIYKDKALDSWEALLTSPDMSTFLTRYHFFKRISEHDSRLLESLDRQRHVIIQQQRQYAQQRQNIAHITEVIGAQKIHVADMTVAQAHMVADIRSQRQAAEQAVAQLQADNHQIESMIRRLIAQRRELARLAQARNPHHYQRPFYGTGRFILPVAGAMISSPFGYRMHPILHRMIEHKGIDFAVSSGTPIRAPDNGEVLYTGWYGGYGKVVIIDHGGDLTSMFCHTSSYVVSPGSRVRKGQLIAYSGSTGMSTGPHLHFEVRKNGTAVNPMQFLR